MAGNLAGVTPAHIMLNREDQDAYIADANLERRDLTRGQKAMLYAVRYPEPSKGGRGKKSLVSSGFSTQRLSAERQVIEHAKELVDLVIDGTMGLDAALAEATRRKQLGMAGQLQVIAES